MLQRQVATTASDSTSTSAGSATEVGKQTRSGEGLGAAQGEVSAGGHGAVSASGAEARGMRMGAWEASSMMGAMGLGEAAGSPLPAAQRSQFEASLGTDLSAVRVHTGEASAQAAAGMGARAFATGDDIHFAAGQFQPGEAGGAQLLAHEVAHTVQQRGGATGAQAKLETTAPGDAMEREADAAAARMVAGQPAQVSQGAAQVIARQTDEPTTGTTGGATDTTGGDGEAAAPAPTVEQLFTMGGAQAWPAVLPQSTMRRAALGMREGSRSRGVNVAPTLTVPRSRTPAAAPTDEQAAALRLATETIQTRMTGIAIPATNGELIVYNGGYAYRAHTHAEGSAAAAAHDQYMAEENPLGLTSARDLQRWAIFRFVLGEGDTSAVNAYDSQLLTLGAGFGAGGERADGRGAAGTLLNRLPAAMRQRLFDHGIYVESDDSFTVLDLNRGVVERGANALRVLQVDQTRLALFSTLAQSTEDVTEGAETHSAREWMLRAQFEQATSEIPDAVIDWPLATAKVAIKLYHWQPGIATWGRIVGWAGAGPSLSAMCRGARDAIWRANGEPASGAFSLDGIETRFTTRARQAGAGAITWAPRPEAAAPE